MILIAINSIFYDSLWSSMSEKSNPLRVYFVHCLKNGFLWVYNNVMKCLLSIVLNFVLFLQWWCCSSTTSWQNEWMVYLVTNVTMSREEKRSKNWRKINYTIDGECWRLDWETQLISSPSQNLVGIFFLFVWSETDQTYQTNAPVNKNYNDRKNRYRKIGIGTIRAKN